LNENENGIFGNFLTIKQLTLFVLRWIRCSIW